MKVVVAGRLSPAQTQRYWRTVVEAGVDLMVIRGSVVSAEHVSGAVKPLNLKRFIYELDMPVVVGGVTTYTAALHLMRTGAAGVLEMADKILFEKGRLLVPDAPIILYIQGDRIKIDI